MRRILLVATLSVPPVGSAAAAQLSEAVAAESPGFTVRVHTMPSAAFATAVLVETAQHVVVIDAGFSDEDAREALSTARNGAAPAALLLTHAHIDHYGGAGWFRAAGAPVISGAGVARQIDEYDAINLARFGAEPPAGRRGLDRVFGNGDSLVVDGVTFTMHELGPGESYADVWWEVSAGQQRIAVIGDVAMYGIPPFMQSGHSADWIRSLRTLERTIPMGTPIYIGHDLRAAAGVETSWDHRVFAWQIGRIEAFRTAVSDLTQRDRLLTAEEIDLIVRTMNADAPENDPAFNFIIATSANILAVELMQEKQKEEFERLIQALFAGTGG